MSTITPTELQSSVSEIVEKPRRTGSKINWWRIIGYVVLLIFAIMYLGPLLMLVNTSLKTTPEFFKNATSLPTTINLDNFIGAWEKADFPRLLLNSILYTAVSTTLYIIMAIFVAFPIARGSVRGHKFLYTLFVIALFLPAALIPQFQLILRLGLYNNPVGYIQIDQKHCGSQTLNCPLDPFHKRFPATIRPNL